MVSPLLIHSMSAKTFQIDPPEWPVKESIRVQRLFSTPTALGNRAIDFIDSPVLTFDGYIDYPGFYDEPPTIFPKARPTRPLSLPRVI